MEPHSDASTKMDSSTAAAVLDDARNCLVAVSLAAEDSTTVDRVAQQLPAVKALVLSLGEQVDALKTQQTKTDEEDGGGEDFGLALTPDDLEGLPEELLAELNITETDKFEGFVVRAVRAAGGVMTLDKLMIACWRERKEVVKRVAFNAKLYRMTRKGLLWTVPSRKGIYTTDRDIGEGRKTIF